MRRYLLLTVHNVNYEELTDALHELNIPFITADVTPGDSWVQWGATKTLLGSNIDAAEAAFGALLDTVGIQEES